MSGIKIVRSLAIAAAAFVVTGAFAAGSMNMDVSAEVKPTCKLISVSAMTFALDLTLGGDVTKDSTVTYRCTKDTLPPKLSVGSVAGGSYASGANPLVGPSGTIAFAVTWTDPTDNGLGLGSGGNQTVTLTGKILEAAYIDKPAGTYSKLVPVSITP